MKKKIRKGVIALAGQGTRFLPATKAMPKEMLPIIDKPIVQYIVEEMVEAGIEQIIFVTSWNKRAIEDHFDHANELEQSLKDGGKFDRYDKIAKLPNMANFIYIRQKGPYGNGTPCINVKDLIGNEHFVYAYGDDLVKSKRSFISQLIDLYNKYDDIDGVVGAQEVSLDEIHKYGCYAVSDFKGEKIVTGTVEKPKKEDAPSNLVSFGRFILPPEIFVALESRSLGKDNELWLIDGLGSLINNGMKILAKPVEDGMWLTTGDPLNLLKTTVEYLKDREDLREDFQNYLYESGFITK